MNTVLIFLVSDSVERLAFKMNFEEISLLVNVNVLLFETIKACYQIWSVIEVSIFILPSREEI